MTDTDTQIATYDDRIRAAYRHLVRDRDQQEDTMQHTTTQPTMQPCGHTHLWPRPAACDPEPAPEAGTAAWHAWRLREQARLTPDQLVPVQR